MKSNSEELLDRQSPDGGWSYMRGGSSWTEPSCYALLALVSDGLGSSPAVRRCVQWLAAHQRADGGWAPHDGVDQSTWVTAAVLLTPPEIATSLDRERASAWLIEQTGRESNFFQRLRMRLLGGGSDPAQNFDGWPWYPGAAAWVGPTALSILALEKLDRQGNQPRIRERIEQGRGFLLARRCRDGGWNHGSTHALGYDSDSYPETTGIAVLALHGVNTSEMTNAVEVAERHLRRSESPEASSWLKLALLARGRKPEAAPQTVHDVTRRVTTEIALAALADAAAEGRNLFVE